MPENTSIKQARSAAEHPILLESATQLANAAKQWEGSEVVGIDTEFVRERTYRADLGLVQVSDGLKLFVGDLACDPSKPAGSTLEKLLVEPAGVQVENAGQPKTDFAKFRILQE